MKKIWVWNVSVRAVEREEIRFAPNTDWQMQARGYRIYFNTDRPIELIAHDQILLTVGEWGNSSWTAFIGTVVECGSDCILLYTSSQYELQLMDIRQLERLFSPLISIDGAHNMIDKCGYIPPFHYDEMTRVFMEAGKQNDKQKNLSVTVRHTSAGGLEQDIDFYFEHIEEESLSPVEDSNICLQLGFAYEGKRIRVKLDAVSGFSASFLCSEISVQLQ
ncbi:hypothetical protein AB4Z29_21800 [Paenibacillus sp. 2TAB23]|uniref:hypothetical protein n=1 Tax=Paenibacillus sp. 2TAB23 TaxID=3233004 RepID=UPI003F96A4F8